ncbi:enoyl-CoA hydratase/isomerase family protein [Streptantibioticus silvisoli]|uniref:Enoyl-CoA hydratase/isomerase family protein n=1 Tax=Streptantibioticus silvisoli TaxID=2705255 RepID=A0ABT6VUP7_9ACTN|nr:enoyl-CoA hydratase/isomerase family protein [Streptantibioticus silvisoli]MDI5962195.1 enoyl-CoA hydratase/isomerase family protein [Streptantibioticus silvisoli]
MAEQHGAVRWERDRDGITVVVLDDPGRTSNMVNARHYDGLNACLDDLEARRATLRGVIVTSAKHSFFSGQDVDFGEIPPQEMAGLYGLLVPVRDQLRRLETLGRPVAAALTGSALGGGLEIGLACHYRVGLDAPGVFWGLAETGMGLMPGGGGVVRATRMFGVAAVVERIVGPGPVYRPAEALRAGLVDELAPSREEVIARARAWIARQPAADDGGPARQRWEQPGYVIPGRPPGTPRFDAEVRALAATLDALPGSAFTPAPRAVLTAAAESVRLDADAAFQAETRHFLDLLETPARANMSKAFFFDAQSIANGAARPPGHPPWRPEQVAVLGGGTLATDIADRCARVGHSVRRNATGDCDLVIHADGDDGSGAGADTGAGRMVIGGVEVGLRLFVPTGRPPLLTVFFEDESAPLVEIACPDGTPDSVVAQAFDVAAGLGIPMVVRGTRTSFVDRLRRALRAEIDALLAEGVDPHTVQRARAYAGFTDASPVAPPAPDAPAPSAPHPVRPHPEARTPDAPRAGTAEPGCPLDELAERLLMAGAVGARRAMADGIVMAEADANLGSLLGAGFPSWTGGVVQYAASRPGGPAAFTTRTAELADRHGERFRLPGSPMPVAALAPVAAPAEATTPAEATATVTAPASALSPDASTAAVTAPAPDARPTPDRNA